METYFLPLGTCFELPIVYKVTPHIEIILLPGSKNIAGGSMLYFSTALFSELTIIPPIS